MKLNLVGHYSYDNINQRDRTIEEYTLGEKHARFDTIYLYSLHTKYVFNLDTKKCVKLRVDKDKPWMTYGD
jgi:hypothetical protein